VKSTNLITFAKLDNNNIDSAQQCSSEMHFTICDILIRTIICIYLQFISYHPIMYYNSSPLFKNDNITALYTLFMFQVKKRTMKILIKF